MSRAASIPKVFTVITGKDASILSILSCHAGKKHCTMRRKIVQRMIASLSTDALRKLARQIVREAAPPSGDRESA